MPADLPDPDVLRPLPDDLPKRGLYIEPIRVDGLTARQPDRLDDGRVRVAFRLTVKDAEDRRCPDLAVSARIVGPERTGEDLGHTDLLGRVTFRMTGPPGTYRCEVLDVAFGGLDWDRGAGAHTAHVVVEPPEG